MPENRPRARSTPMRWLLAAIAFGMFATPAMARPGQPSLEPTARMQVMATALEAGPTIPVLDLLATAGLSGTVRATGYAPPEAPPWAAPATGPLDARPMNLRLALTMLTQAYGADDLNAVLAAQASPDRPALVLRSGHVTLADLRRLLRDTRLQAAADAGPLTLTVPLVIWSGASLALGPGEVLTLSRADGVFVANFGLLQLDKAEIGQTGERAATSPVFVPFVTTADGGVIQTDGARFIGLGFGKSPKFSGVSVLQGTIRSPRQPSWFHASTFDGVMTVSVSMAHDVALRANHFSNMRGAGLVISRSARAQVLLNVFSGRMRTNAVILEEGSTLGRIAGNVVLGGKRTGIVVRNVSTGATVAHNIVWARDGGGIALIKSDCGAVTENLVLGNKQKGIEVRTSLNASVIGNAIYDNHSAGIWVSAQPAGATTLVRGNLLAENGAGIAAAAGEAILLEGNDFTQQFAQFVSGDLAPQSAHIARSLRGEAQITLTSTGSGSGTVIHNPDACTQ